MCHRQAHAGDLAWEVQPQPSGQAGAWGGDDDLVKTTQVDRVGDRGHRVGVSDYALNGHPGGLANRRQGMVELAPGLPKLLVVWVYDLVQAVGGSWHEQREYSGTALCPLANRVQQLWRGGSLVLHDEHLDRVGGLHDWNSLLVLYLDDPRWGLLLLFITLPAVRVHLSEERIEIRLSRWQKVLGLMSSISVALSDVSDVKVIENPLRDVMRSGLKVGLRLPWLYYVCRSIRLDQAWVVRRGVPAVSFAVRNAGALERVTISSDDAQGLAGRLGSGR